MRLLRSFRVLGLLLAASSASCTSSTSGASCLLGPCGTGTGKLEMDFVVGYPDSLVSQDPRNEVGVVTVGDSVVLRYVHAAPPFRQYIFDWGCSQATISEPRLRWAVTDSGTANITRINNGTAVLRATRPGAFTVLTTTNSTQTLARDSWIDYIVACPSGRLINSITAFPRTLAR